jgi:heme exporter protein A
MGLEGKNLGCMRGERLLFRDLNFAINGGEALVLRGANGSGKSSLLKIVATLLKQSAGDVRWQNRAISDDPDLYRRQIGYIGHLDAVKAALSVQENLQQWANIFCPARLLLKPARLWLLDEPTVSLDGDGVARLAHAIAQHREQGGLVMAATHIDLGLNDAQELTIELAAPR